MTPMDQQSTALPYGFLLNTSGATYPGVPHAVPSWSSVSAVLERPKSLIMILESSAGLYYNVYT